MSLLNSCAAMWEWKWAEVGATMLNSMECRRDEFATPTDLSDRHDHDATTNQTHTNDQSQHWALIGAVKVTLRHLHHVDSRAAQKANDQRFSCVCNENITFDCGLHHYALSRLQTNTIRFVITENIPCPIFSLIARHGDLSWKA